MDRSSIGAWNVRYRYWIDIRSIHRQMLSQYLQFLTAFSSPRFTLPSTLLVRQFLSLELYQNVFPTRSRLLPRPFNHNRVYNFSILSHLVATRTFFTAINHRPYNSWGHPTKIAPREAY